MARKKQEKSRVNKELNGFEININSLGEIHSTFEIEKINDFLNREVTDKKLINRKDFSSISSKKKDPPTSK